MNCISPVIFGYEKLLQFFDQQNNTRIYDNSSFSIYKKREAIAIAGKTSPTRGTKIDGRFKLIIKIHFLKLKKLNIRAYAVIFVPLPDEAKHLLTLADTTLLTIQCYNLAFVGGDAQKYFQKIYSKSFDLGFRPGSFDKKPKINNETKKITTV